MNTTGITTRWHLGDNRESHVGALKIHYTFWLTGMWCVYIFTYKTGGIIVMHYPHTVLTDHRSPRATHSKVGSLSLLFKNKSSFAQPDPAWTMQDLQTVNSALSIWRKVQFWSTANQSTPCSCNHSKQIWFILCECQRCHTRIRREAHPWETNWAHCIHKMEEKPRTVGVFSKIQ